MEKNVTLMQEKNQEKFPYVQIILDAMKLLKWIPARLAKESGVSDTTLTHMFKDGRDITGKNLYKVLNALNLINTDQPPHRKDCPFASCDQKLIDICKKVKELIESDTHWGASLEANIESFKKGLDNDKKLLEVEKRINVLEKLTSTGQPSGTTPRPASRTGRRRKAG